MAANSLWTTSVKLVSDNTASTNIYTNGMYQLSSGANIGYMPQFTTYVGGIGDPLSRGMQQAAPQPETPEQWLRRRVRETCWMPA